MGVWKESRSGYLVTRVSSFSPYYAMAKKNWGTIKQHRLIMAEYLGRCLRPWELVHHINGIKDDNRIENLELIVGRGRHYAIHLSDIKFMSTLICPHCGKPYA